MKVFLLAPNENWICDRIVKEWYAYMGHISTLNIHDADIIWLQAGWCWNHIDPLILRQKKVILTEHHIVPEKFGLNERQQFLYRDQFVDAYHVPNKFTREFIQNLTTKPIHTLGYWFDPAIWYHQEKKACKIELGLTIDQFVIGSFQRDTEGGSRNPKLEKGPDLFCDYVEKLNRDDLHILLGGWRREYVMDRLSNAGIPFTMMEKAPIEVIQKMYNACDLYIVGSRQEGGPQAIYEAAAMKVPIISTDMGVASDVLCDACIIDIASEIYYPTHHDVNSNYKNVQKFSIIKHAVSYEKMLQGYTS